MIFEQATIQVSPDKAAAFEAALASTTPLFRKAQGCTSLALERVVETPGRYVLRIGWTTVEDHTETFTKSADFAEFVATTGPFMTETPSVIHVVPTSLF